MIIDTHAHLHGEQYSADLEAVITRAREVGVANAVLIGVDIEDSQRAIEMSHIHDGWFYAVSGVHPHEAKTWNSESRQRLEAQLSDPRVVAIGEIGLDYHYDFSPRDQQHIVFKAQLEIACDLGKPIVIHCREAYDDVLVALREFYGGSRPAGLNGVLHCYFGTLEQAQEAEELGFIIGVGGSCTFKKAEELHEVVRRTPLSRIVLETDAPYMAPVPYRGKRNEPAYLQHVVARVAELKGMSPEQVELETTENARRLYRLPGLV